MWIGAGAVYLSLQKQKMNTKSLTKLVGANDKLPQVLWTKFFMQAQGYGTDNILYQDNQSPMKMEQNGKAFSWKRTWHINVQYFFITDQIAEKEVAIQYCPTKQMVVDYCTKPLQGGLFYEFQDLILGLAPMETIDGDQRRVLASNPASGGKQQSPKRGVPQHTTGISNTSSNQHKEVHICTDLHSLWELSRDIWPNSLNALRKCWTLDVQYTSYQLPMVSFEVEGDSVLDWDWVLPECMATVVKELDARRIT
jgi:hypothetical protein